ncbi:MAG TPA: AMP-binding protein, partial [Longimicrobiaceae bacterium]|nr:AMP-binding protein [Longimicrobiaceae bacterium]
MNWTEIDHRPAGAPAAAAGGCATLVELLRARAAADPGRQTWTFLPDGLEPGATLTPGELDARARGVAAVLQERGLRGQPVLLAFPPGLDFLAGFFGCLYAGAVAVPVQAPEHPRALPRLAAVARSSGARLALTTAGWMERLGRIDPGGELSGLDWLPLGEAPAQAAGAWRDPAVSPDDLAFLQYTSGSTAEPRGVMVAHRHLLANEAMIQDAFAQGPGSVVVGWLPLFHDMGLVGTLLQPLWSGGRCLLMAPATFLQRPLVWMEAISRHRATTSGGPSFAYDLCARRAAADPGACAGLDLSCWRVAFNGAEPVRAATLERFAA